MGQRKLTDSESHWIGLAASAIESLMVGCRCLHPWDKRFADLLAVAYHATTDGNPYIEPQPEIGEGYRLATESDQYREDRDIVLGSQWMKAIKGVFVENARYRVPIDRIPTDEDAKQRPMVMVRDNDDQVWYKTVLIAVSKGDEKPFYEKSFGKVDCWRECRFPYPGELP